MNSIKPHTIFMLIGPSGCGKTYFCKNILIPQLEKLEPLPNRTKVTYNYISSDEIRRFLLNDCYSRTSQSMLSVSKQAFNVLFEQVKACTSFPVNSEYVIVDTKGTSEIFRKALTQIADDNHYNIVPIIFNFSNFDDYGTFTKITRDTTKDIKIIRAICSNIRSTFKNADNVIHVKLSNFDNPDLICFDIVARKQLLSSYIDNNSKIFVVGDIHGCYDEFIELLSKVNIAVENNVIVSNPNNLILVINGDYIDKGPDSANLIDFMYKNLETVKITVGNHENRLYKELTGELPHSDERIWYNTYGEIINDSETISKFMKVYKNSLPFVANDYCIITHAPCKNKYLGKIDNKSIRRQSYMEYKNPLYEHLKNCGVFDESRPTTLRVFGHLRTTSPNCIDNRYLLDSACSLGGKLSGLLIDKQYNKLFTVDSKQPKLDDYDTLEDFKIPRSNLIDNNEITNVLNNLDFDIQTRIANLINNKVNFISGTMSPCDTYNNKLETIESAINYYKSNNVNEVVIQPKYMGSRMNMYLFQSNEESYSISRRGYKFKLDLTNLYDMMRIRLHDFIDWSKVKLIIIDGELLPWNIVDIDGISKEYKVLYESILNELNFIQTSGFEDKLYELFDKFSKAGFHSEALKVKKAELKNKYSTSEYTTYSEVDKLHEYYTAGLLKNELDVYKNQLDLYACDGKLEFKPFAILKIVYKDGSEVIYYDNNEMTNEYMFNLLNSDQCKSFNLNNDDDVKMLVDQFKTYTTINKHEGVVMKPNSLQFSNQVAPYLKIRNPAYLTITYGYDYQHSKKYDKLIKRKSIKKKLSLSIKEWYLGLQLLRIPYSSLQITNSTLIKLYVSMVDNINEETVLDPRL